MRIKVWDISTRLFHWVLVVSITISFVSIKVLDDIESHVTFGAVALVLIVFRLLWGVVGPSTARFSHFLYGPKRLWIYLKQPRSEKSAYVGHNPLAGWAVLFLLLTLSIQITTGLFADDEIYTTGPLAGSVSTSFSEFSTRIHYLNSDLLLGLIALHLFANAFYFFALKINLVKPMITGYQNNRNTATNLVTEPVKEHPVRAVVCLLLGLLICYVIFEL